MPRGIFENIDLRALLRGLQSLVLVLSSLMEVLLLDREGVEELRRALREECIRQRAEHEFLSRYL